MPVRFNIADLKKDLKLASQQLDMKMSDTLKVVLMLILTRAARRSPISPYLHEDPGRFAASWSISRDKPGSFALKKGQTGTPEMAIQRASALSFTNPYAKWYIYNNVPYAPVIEHGLYPGSGPRTVGGYSKQAPEGVLWPTIFEVEDELRDLVTKGE